MKRFMNVGKPLNNEQMKSIKGGNEFVIIRCSNGATVCISCETEEECAANAAIACAQAGGSES